MDQGALFLVVGIPIVGVFVSRFAMRELDTMSRERQDPDSIWMWRKFAFLLILPVFMSLAWAAALIALLQSLSGP